MLKTILLAVVLAAPALWAAEPETKRLHEATMTLTEIMGIPDRSIPESLFEKAECAIIIPGLKKGGFVVAAKYGRGFASCRTSDGGWSAPASIRIEGGSFGLQIGGASSDVVLLVMNPSGMQKLLKSKFTLGAEATAAAGPVGRNTSAQTDALMNAEMLTWSRSRGAFAGVSLDGSTLRPDDEANIDLYGKGATNPDIIGGKFPVPADAKEFLAALAKYGGTRRRG